MLWSVDWDGGFVVGGDDSRRLTPNFRLKEFRSATGKVRVHRELVTALQMLRGRYAKPLAIQNTDADGLGARVAADSIADLMKAADSLRAHNLFQTVTHDVGALHVVIPNPAHLPDIGLEQALESAFSITSSFETSGDRFQQVSGNFDGAGISYGPAQWNFGSGTLAALFRHFQDADAATLAGCFIDPIDYQEWQRILGRPVAEQIRWADGISTGRMKQEVVEPWRGYLQAVGRVPSFRAIMVETAMRAYGARVLDAVKYLQRLAPDVLIDHLRCFCSLYDLAIQQGSLDKARAEIEARVKQARPTTQFELVRIAVEERGRKASPEWRADCVSRRVGILNGIPETVDGHQRANLSFYLLRDVRIKDARALLTADVSPQLARVANALAAGDTLLA